MNRTHPGDDALVAYVLEELDDPERSEIESHVSDCAVCRGIAQRLSGALDAYRETNDAGAPAGVLIDLLEAQAAARDRSMAPWWRFKPVSASAGVALVALLFMSGFWAGRSTIPVTATPQAHLKEKSEIPWPLPTPPAIDFQAERPLSIRFSLAAETTRVGHGAPEEWESLQDSL